MKPTLLIDGDILLHKATVMAEYECDWGDDVWVLSTNVQQAKDIFASMVEGLLTDLSTDKCAVLFSGPRNFRYDLTPDYKSNRKGTRKPLGFNEVKKWVMETPEYNAQAHPHLEADDYLGILATRPSGGERIICSTDKDLKTIPGKLYRGEGEVLEISHDEAEYNWLLQALTGDATDGYKGCPGIGPKTAEKILSKPGDRWENVRQAYLKAGLTEDDALLNARLARILRWEDWDSKNQKVKLWTPEND